MTASCLAAQTRVKSVGANMKDAVLARDLKDEQGLHIYHRVSHPAQRLILSFPTGVTRQRSS